MTYGWSINKALLDFNINTQSWPSLAADRVAWRSTLRHGHPPGFTAPAPPLRYCSPAGLLSVEAASGSLYDCREVAAGACSRLRAKRTCIRLAILIGGVGSPFNTHIHTHTHTITHLLPELRELMYPSPSHTNTQ